MPCTRRTVYAIVRIAHCSVHMNMTRSRPFEHQWRSLWFLKQVKSERKGTSAQRISSKNCFRQTSNNNISSKKLNPVSCSFLETSSYTQTTCTCTSTHMDTHTRTHTHAHTHAHTYIRMHIHTRTYIHTHAHTHTHIHTYTHACTHPPTHTPTHTHTHTVLYLHHCH